jgi:hypothetical protein
MAAKEKLTLKQRRFVEAYLGRANGNATEAARLAGYSDPEQSGWENKHKQAIQDRISERVAEAAMPADEVLSRLASIARGSLCPFVEVTPDGRWRTDLSQPAALENFHLLAELGYTEHGPKLKIHDPVQALVQIGRHHKLFTDKAELAGKDGDPLFGYDVFHPGSEPGTGEGGGE